MGAAERSVRYLKELEKVELLEIKQRGLGKTNLYRLHLTTKVAVPDRQFLPFKRGNHRRSRAANSTALSIEEYTSNNTHIIIPSREMRF